MSDKMPYDLDQLRALRDRVAKLTGPDREASHAVQRSIGGWRYEWHPEVDMAYWYAPDKKCADTSDFLPPDVTASIDAVEALRQYVLPDFAVTAHSCDPDASIDTPSYAYAEVWLVVTEDNCHKFNGTPKAWAATAPTEPMARLLALLAALIAQEMEKSHG